MARILHSGRSDFHPAFLIMDAMQSPPVAAPGPSPSGEKPVAAPVSKGLFARLERKVRRILGPKPIDRKMTAITMLACTAAMLISGAFFFTFDILSQFMTSRTGIQSLSRVAAENAGQLMGSDSSPALIATLNALMDYPHVTGVMIYSADGNAIARPTKNVKAVFPAIIPVEIVSRTHLGMRSLSHFEPLKRNGETTGLLVIEMGLSELWERLRLYALITLLVFVLATVVARVLLGRLQGMISGPIVELAKVAGTVAKESNYALRAEKRSDDEVGHLVGTFNDMLSEIQKRDEALSQAQAGLECNVLARTSQLQSEVQERKQAEQALKDSEMRYRNLFENNPMPMWVMDLETLEFVAVNNAAVLHYGYSHSEFELLSLPMLTEGAEPLEVERAFRTSQKSFDAGEWRHRKRNGEVVEVHLTAHAIVFAGKVTKIVLANDVTERNRAQRQLDEMHKKLIETSRAAGMAEVATGVLHNVGNVLNSVNVSANVLADSVRKSKAASVRKIAELFEANKADLPAFFGPNGKGQMMPGYLATLAKEIESEQDGRLSEIEQLTKNISHIKDIVAMQQDYAKVSGLMEDASPRTLVEETLRMAESELKLHSVNVEVKCPPEIPAVNTDRHKVLQILMNLITNAQQAMEDTAPEKRLLSIEVARCDEFQIAIIIKDRGCGIESQNLTRVFNHGFTTKPTGHGFGLHSAANAATEIRGSLRGESEGSGKGSTFTLRLPIAARTEVQKAA